jgi:hypothetical protein
MGADKNYSLNVHDLSIYPNWNSKSHPQEKGEDGAREGLTNQQTHHYAKVNVSPHHIVNHSTL